MKQPEIKENVDMIIAIGKCIFFKPVAFLLPMLNTQTFPMDWCMARDEDDKDYAAPFIMLHFTIKETEYIIGALYDAAEMPRYILADTTHSKDLTDFVTINQLMKELKMRFGTPVKYGSKA